MAAAAARCLRDSFLDDPICGRGSPLWTAEEYDAFGVEIFGWFLWNFQVYSMTECALAAEVAEDGGADDDDAVAEQQVLATALWEPASPTLGFMLRLLICAGWMLWKRGFWRAIQLGRLFLTLESKRHKHAPTGHHLQMLGTSPAAQGQGCGCTHSARHVAYAPTLLSSLSLSLSLSLSVCVCARARARVAGWGPR